MPLCLTHNQSYTLNEFCVYCGDPVQKIATFKLGEYKDHYLPVTGVHICSPITDESGTYCKICKQSMFVSFPDMYIEPKGM